MLEERIGVLEEENSLLLIRLSQLESVVDQLENVTIVTDVRLDGVETDV